MSVWPSILSVLVLLSLLSPSTDGASSQPRVKLPKSSLASSAIIPLYGDVYPSGLYYASMAIGDPPKPYFLDVDSGSDLTWLQCDAPCLRCSKGPHPWYKPAKGKLVLCPDPLCAAVQNEISSSGTNNALSVKKKMSRKCDSAHQQCDYKVNYADEGSSSGVLVVDSFAFRLTNASVVRPSLAFGCGYDQEVPEGNLPVATDGVLGLGRGQVSVLSQLKEQGVTKDVVGHCLSSKGGGFLFFGEELVPYSRATWVPMARSAAKSYYYSPGSANMLFNGRSLGAKQMNLVLDSGSSYTYFAANPYEVLISALKSQLGGTPLKEASDDPTLPLCWKGPKLFKSVNDVKSYFKPLSFSFTSGKKAILELPPENYLIISKYGNSCLGILNGTEAGLKDLNVIGDISMLDLMVVYDNEEERIGWIRAVCDRIPKSGSLLA